MSAIRKWKSPVTRANVSQFCQSAILKMTAVMTATSLPTFAEIKITHQVGMKSVAKQTSYMFFITVVSILKHYVFWDPYIFCNKKYD